MPGESPASGKKDPRNLETAFQPVSFSLCSDYDVSRVEDAVQRALEPLGGMGRFVGRGQKVLLKPNLLNSRPVDRGVCTHPALVRAVAKLAGAEGAEVLIGDSPALERTETAARKVGLDRIAAETGASIVSFDRPAPAGSDPVLRYRNLQLAAPALEADRIINLPKCKTHGQMVMTLGVKNMFGCVVGKQKARWHFQTGGDLHAFARLLLDIYLRLRPCLNIIDGVVSMEGEGPGSGTLRRTGFVAACVDGLSLDWLLCRILGVNPLQVPVLAVALKEGLLPLEGSDPAILGQRPPGTALAGFRLPESAPLHFGPAFLQGTIDRLITARPSIDTRLCTLCGACTEICSAGAIITRRDSLSIDRGNCISCFCCQEVCPSRAIRIEKGPLFRLMNT